MYINIKSLLGQNHAHTNHILSFGFIIQEQKALTFLIINAEFTFSE